MIDTMINVTFVLSKLSVQMGINASKLKCLYLPAQSGKTRKVEDLIAQYKELHECIGDGDVNIIISANNILLVKQTEARMVKDLATDSTPGANDATISAGVFSWTSGEKDCNITARELKDRILEEEVEMVVMCAHATRLKYLAEMLRLLGSSRFFTKKINIWIDEADKSVKLWSKHSELLALPCIHQVTLVSASFASVIAKYGRIQVMPYSETHPDCYRRLKDAIRIEENFAAGAADYVRHVMLKNREKLVRPGLRAFIPGEMRKASHNAIADFLHTELGFVVIIINGERKEILVPGQPTIDLRCYLTVDSSSGDPPVEFNAQLSKLYKDNDWARFPLAITGFYCVQRGVTFQSGPEVHIDPKTNIKTLVHDGFLFDYGVIPPVPCKIEAYQAMARLFGNVGDFPNYKPVEIYTSGAMFRKVEKQEEMAVNLARMVKEQGLLEVGKKEMMAAANFEKELNWQLHTSEFPTLEEANMYIKSLGAIRRAEPNHGIDGELRYEFCKATMASWGKMHSFQNAQNAVSVALGRMWSCFKVEQGKPVETFICRVITRIS